MIIKIVPSAFTNNQKQDYSKRPQSITHIQIPDSFEKSNISFKGGVFDYEERLNELLNARPWIKRKLGVGKKEIEKTVKIEMAAVCMHASAEDKEKDALNKKLLEQQEETIKAHKETLKSEREKNELLVKQIEENKKHSDDLAKSMKLQAEKKESDQVLKTLDEDIAARRKYINSINEENTRRLKIEDGKGWARIAGENEEHGIGLIKKQLEENFINKLSLEKKGMEVSMPNGILFYGPKSTGKTYFADAFAQQAKCNYIEVKTEQSDYRVIEDLEKALKESKELYENTKERSIILLDEFDSVAQLSKKEKQQIEEKGQSFFSETNTGKLKKLLSNCANDSKATVFMTTNHPLNIDSSILTESDCIPMKIFLGPPEWGDVESMFKYHLTGVSTEIANYDNIVEKAMEVRKEHNAFSSKRIKLIADSCAKFAKENLLKITENDILRKMGEKGPDISPEKLKEFAKTVIKLTERIK